MAKRMDVFKEEPHIVEDFYIGNTHIKIADNSCVSKEEAAKIMERLSDIIYRALTEQYYRDLAAGRNVDYMQVIET